MNQQVSIIVAVASTLTALGAAVILHLWDAMSTAYRQASR